MKAMVGVLAPNAGDMQYNRDFRLRLNRTGQELTLKNLYTLCKTEFDESSLSATTVYTDVVVPASGYYLTGLLRSSGYDTCMTNRTDTEALRELARHSPVAVCISTSMILSSADLAGIAARVREVMPDVKIIAGGPLIWKQYLHATGCDAAAPPQTSDDGVEATRDADCLFQCNGHHLDVDVMVVSPHGASILLELLEEIRKGAAGDLSGIPNLAIREDSGNFSHTRRAVESIDWNKDFTRWDLVDEIPPWVPIRTSIGCPHRCEFCDFCRMAPDLFMRSGASLREELAMITARKQRPMVHVTDDIVFASRRRLQDVCQAFTESRAVWGGFLRAARFIPAEIDLIRRSRFRWGVMGVESGDQGQLDRMQKRQKSEVSRMCVEALDQAGITLLLTMLVGFPGENEQTLANTIGFLDGLDVGNTSYDLFPLWVFPLSGLASPQQRQRWQLTGVGSAWRHGTMDRAGAEAACAQVFRSVHRTPYNYADESTLFNTRWPAATRRDLFDLRRRLTVEMMDSSPQQTVVRTASELVGRLGFPGVVPPENWMANLSLRTRGAGSSPHLV